MSLGNQDMGLKVVGPKILLVLSQLDRVALLVTYPPYRSNCVHLINVYSFLYKAVVKELVEEM